MTDNGFNIKDYDILVSCCGDPNVFSSGLVRISENRLNIIDRLSSTGIGIYDGRIYRLMRHRPYVTSKVLEMAVYEEAPIYDSSYASPLHLVYHDISDAHDIFIHDGLIYIVSSGTNEIVCLDEKTFKIVKRIKFDGSGNAWHINCLSVIGGRICISAFNMCNENFGWGNTPTKGAGFIMDIATKEKIWEGLSMPHNPYQVGNKIAVCNSETKSVLFRDPDGHIEEVPIGGFTRGLQFDGRYMFVGASAKLPDTIENAMVVVYDTIDKKIVHEIALPFSQIYSVCLIKKINLAIPPIKNLFAEKNAIIDLIGSKQNRSLLSAQKVLDSHKLKVELMIKFLPDKFKINTDYKLTVRVENHSEMTMQSIAPFPINMAYHWKNIDNTYAVYDGDRTSLAIPLFPFACIDIDMLLRTPSVPGEYILEISMVQESKFWFEEYCDNLPRGITVNVED